MRAAGAGFRQGRVMGDPMQQGGVFIIRPGGELAFSYVSKHAGDHPEAEEVVGLAVG